MKDRHIPLKLLTDIIVPIERYEFNPRDSKVTIGLGVADEHPWLSQNPQFGQDNSREVLRYHLWLIVCPRFRNDILSVFSMRRDIFILLLLFLP